MPYNFKDISTWNTPVLNLGQQMQPISVGGRMFYPPTAGGQINTTPGYIPTNTTTVNSGASQQTEGAQQTGGGFSDAMSKGLSVAGGVMNLANTYMDLSSIADTSQQWNDIEDVRNVGRNQYSSFDTLAQDYSMIEDMPQSYDYRDIRGKNDGEMVAGVGNAMLQGASAGAAFGPWGCVCAGTRVITNDGRFVNIEDLRQEDGIIGWNGTSHSTQSIFWMQDPAEKECVEITFSNGDILRCSTDHPILYHKPGRNDRQTINSVRHRVPVYSFIEAGKLNIGDIVGAISDVPIFGSVDVPEARILGMLIGDGSYGKNHGARLNSGDKNTWDYIEDNNIGVRLRVDDSKYNSEFRCYRIINGAAILRKHGMYEQTHLDKRFPNDIHMFSKRSLAEFIAGLFDTDGCIPNVKVKKEGRIEFVQTNHALLIQLKEQLLKFGIHSFIRKTKEKKHTIKERVVTTKAAYILIIKDSDSIQRFNENIPLLIDYKKNNLKKLADFKLKLHQRNPRYFGVRPIKVRNIKKIGKHLIYNLQADNDHTYIANGIITHNTVAGAAIGLGTGLAGVFTGNKKARQEQRWLQDNAVMAEHSAQDNLNAGQEQLRDYQFRSGVARMADWGGKIERRNESIRQFADKVLHKKPKRISDEATGSFRIERKHCNGGIMIRIKR